MLLAIYRFDRATLAVQTVSKRRRPEKHFIDILDPSAVALDGLEAVFGEVRVEREGAADAAVAHHFESYAVRQAQAAASGWATLVDHDCD